MSARAGSPSCGHRSETRESVDPEISSTSTGVQIPLKDYTPQDVKDLHEGDGPAAGSDCLEEEVKDVIPNGGYGWVNVGCVVLQNSVTWGEFRFTLSIFVQSTYGALGVNTTYGVYSAYYLQNNHFEGGSTFGYAWVGGLCVAVALLIAPGVNWLVRTFGFRIPLVIGE